MKEAKCPFCGLRVDKTKGFNYKNLYYHTECWTKFVNGEKQEAQKVAKEKVDKQQVEILKTKLKNESLVTDNTPLSDEEVKAKDKVINYLKCLTHTEHLDVKIYSLLKKYYKDYNFSYQGMFLALRYFYELKGNPPFEDCVGIIPLIYREAQEQERIKKKVERDIKNIDLNKIVTEKVVVIPSTRNQIEKDKDYINIEDIGV